MVAKKKVVRCGMRVFLGGSDHNWLSCALGKGHLGECERPCLKPVEGRLDRASIIRAASQETCALPDGHDGVCKDEHGNEAYPKNATRFSILHGKVFTVYGKRERVLSRKRLR